MEAMTLSVPVGDLVLGLRVDPVSQRMAVDLILERVFLDGPGSYVCLTNVHTTVESQGNAELRAACGSAFLSVPDGMPLVWILRRRGARHVQKVTGIEFMPQVAAAGLDLGVRHFFFGGAPGVAEAAGRELQARVPGTQVVGAYSPPFGSPHEWNLDELRGLLRVGRPHLMWVGVGAPKQELWMAGVAETLEVPMMVGVGAGFDYLAGTKAAAPRVMSRLGLEWLFRLLAEPRRLWHRYLVGNSTFLWLLARERAVGAPSRGMIGKTDR